MATPNPPSLPPQPVALPTLGVMSVRTTQFNRRGKMLVALGTATLIGIGIGVFSFPFTYRFTAAQPRVLTAGVDLALVLAPILAAAAGIERTLETLWDLIESYLRSIVAFLAGRSEWLRWATDEWKAARKNLDNLAQQAFPDEASLLAPKEIELTQALENAAAALEKAEQRLASISSTTQYKDAKRVASILLGIFLGIFIATIAPLQMFALLGVQIPPSLDVLITGIAIGTGSTPVHSLIGILQQGKDTLDGAQQYLKTHSDQVRSNTR